MLRLFVHVFHRSPFQLVLMIGGFAILYGALLRPCLVAVASYYRWMLP